MQQLVWIAFAAAVGVYACEKLGREGKSGLGFVRKALAWSAVACAVLAVIVGVYPIASQTVEFALRFAPSR